MAIFNIETSEGNCPKCGQSVGIDGRCLLCEMARIHRHPPQEHVRTVPVSTSLLAEIREALEFYGEEMYKPTPGYHFSLLFTDLDDFKPEGLGQVPGAKARAVLAKLREVKG